MYYILKWSFANILAEMFDKQILMWVDQVSGKCDSCLVIDIRHKTHIGILPFVGVF